MDLLCVLGFLSAVFSGFNGGTIFVFPPKKVLKTIYRCDNKFYIDDILGMYDTEKKYGIVLMNGKEYNIYLCTQTGKHIDYKILLHEEIYQPNKHNKGGQSAHRFEGIRRVVHGHFVTQIAEDIVSAYMKSNHTESIISKLIIGGPAEFKTEVRESNIFQQHMAKYLIKTVTTAKIDISAARYALQMAIEEVEIMEIHIVDAELNDYVQEQPDILIFSEKECINALSLGELKKIYINREYIDRTALDEIDKILETDIKTDIIFSKSDKLKIFGCIIGVKYFSIE